VKFAPALRTAAILFTAALFAAAQQPSREPWHLQGALGMTLSKTSQTSLLPIPGTAPSADYETAAGNLRLSLSGYGKDPQLLPFNLDFEGEHGSNKVDIGGYRDNLLNWGVNTTFLPGRTFPLRFFYRKSQFGARGGSFGQDAYTSTLGVDWSLRQPKLPVLTAGYTRFVNDIRLPTSLFDTSYRQGHAFASAEDTWKKWNWGIGFDNYVNTSNLAGGFVLPVGFTQTLRVAGLRLRRPFWEKRADFRLENRNEWRNDQLPDSTHARSTDNYTSASLHIQHRPKFGSSYFYIFTRVGFGRPSGIIPGLPSNATLLASPTFDSHFAGGRADYQRTDSIRVFQEIRYQHVTTPASPGSEFRKSLTESLSGASYTKSWKKFKFDGSYTGHVQIMGTNLGNRTNTFSNDVLARVAWGAPGAVRLVGSAYFSKLNLVDQLNGFSDNRRYRLELETRRWHNLQLHLAAERFEIELLNLSGDLNQRGINLTAKVDHQVFTLGYTRTLGSGFGALFPAFVQLHFQVSAPLPLEQLLSTPLLDRSARTNAAYLILRLRHNLNLSANWRTERDVLVASRFGFRQMEGRLRYGLGKFMFDAAFGTYRNDTLAGTEFSGLRTNRYVLRVTRDFRIF
jgi:hypothetical protein